MIDQCPIRSKSNNDDWLRPNKVQVNTYDWLRSNKAQEQHQWLIMDQYGPSVTLIIDYCPIRPKCYTCNWIKPKCNTYDLPRLKEVQE